MKKRKLVRLTTLALLSAIVWLMSFTPLGYFKTVGLEVSFLMIPVLIGAILLGPTAGAILGLQFGITSFIQCFGMSGFGTALMTLNPVATFIVCVPTRLLAGWIPGLIFRGLSTIDKTPKKLISSIITALSGSLSNTVFFMGTLVLFFWQSEILISMQATLGTTNVLWFILLFVGVQGLIEILVGAVVAPPIAIALRHATARMGLTEQ